MPSEAFAPGLNKSSGMEPERKALWNILPTLHGPGHTEQNTGAEQNATPHSGQNPVKTELNLKGLLGWNFHSDTPARGPWSVSELFLPSSLIGLPPGVSWQPAGRQ